MGEGGEQQAPGGDGPASPSPGEVRAQLERTVASVEFPVSERAQRFLRYVVEEALAGRGERIKAYTIAVEVLGRDEGFDANADPAVRLEAGRLRRALERYYLVAGQADPVLIAIPKGAYVPVFTARAPRRPRSRPSPTSRRRRRPRGRGRRGRRPPRRSPWPRSPSCWACPAWPCSGGGPAPAPGRSPRAPPRAVSRPVRSWS